jgi:hypothetical protein
MPVKIIRQHFKPSVTGILGMKSEKCGKLGISIHYLWEGSMSEPLWKTVLIVPQKVK